MSYLTDPSTQIEGADGSIVTVDENGRRVMLDVTDSEVLTELHNIVEILTDIRALLMSHL